MNILIVGAGAVGLVYGQHLSMAGHRVTFFVKEQHRNDLKSGVSMIRKRRLVKDEVRHFSDFSLLSQWNHVAGEEWDYVFLAISSDALRALPFPALRQQSQLCKRDRQTGNRHPPFLHAPNSRNPTMLPYAS